MKQDLLIEIGTEELPPKILRALAENFAGLVMNRLTSRMLIFDEANTHYFATPRRLAVLIRQLESQQPDVTNEKRGPFVKAAYDDQNQPTKALEGFAKVCGVPISQLETIETEQGLRLIHRSLEKGKNVKELLSEIIQEALKALPLGKSMRWGSGSMEFPRPIHWITLLYGKDEINAKIAGLTSGRITYGHRFHHPEVISLNNASDYEKILEKNKVIADFDKRKKIIREQIQKKAHENNASALIDEDLLNEVTGIVEWPIALLVSFDKEFLEVPREALISAMQHHQKSFPLFNNNMEMQPQFITISNIESKDPTEVIRGNERVMRARLSDAKFFYDTDRKQKLETHLEGLKDIVFQKNLGTLYDKSQRIAALAETIVKAYDLSNVNADLAKRAGLFCKTDLLTAMVGEFPELQGIMGYYYAENDGEKDEVAQAIREHYSPRFAGDATPKKLTGCVIALADRIDTLTGIFGINQIPTGEKDPFGLRRAALGILRILIEKELNIDLYQLIESAKNLYTQPLPNKDLVNSLYNFIVERLRAWYQDQNITPDVLAAVLASRGNSHVPLEIHQRILAVQAFKKLPEATALAAANKRVSNLLIKNNQLEQFTKTDPLSLVQDNLFEKDIERSLFKEILLKTKNSKEKAKNYTEQLLELASLRNPVDTFFDSVMVMDENEKLRNNRLALLAALRNLFLNIADISQLQF